MLSAGATCGPGGTGRRPGRLRHAGTDLAWQRATARDHRHRGRSPMRSPPPGLLPSATHERVRNIVAVAAVGARRRPGRCAAMGRRAGRGDSGRRACLAALPGRFWFGIDDGRGDVSGLHVDAGVHVFDADSVALLLAGDGHRRAAGRRRKPCRPWSTVAAGVPAHPWKELADNRTRGSHQPCWPDSCRRPRTPGASCRSPPVRRRSAGSNSTTDRIALGAAVPLGCCPPAPPSSWPRSRPRW